MIEPPGDADGLPVIRTDFSDETTWQIVRDAVVAEDYAGSGYQPNLMFVERRDLASMGTDAVVALLPSRYPAGYEQPFLIIVDAVAISSQDHPVLLVDLSEQETSSPFRALPREIAAIEANLSLANMDFFEFGSAVDSDGVFRGFNGVGQSADASGIRRSELDQPERLTVPLDADDDDAAEHRRLASEEAGRRICADLDRAPGARALSGQVAAVRIGLVLPRAVDRVWPLIANLDITRMSTANEAVVGNEFRMGTYNLHVDGFVGTDGQVLCRWTELTEPTRVAMTWSWMRTVQPAAHLEPRLPREAELSIVLTNRTIDPDDSRVQLGLTHANLPAEWVEDMTAIWTSKIDQWTYQSRSRKRRR